MKTAARIGAVAWMGLIFWLSSIPDPQVPSNLTTPGHAFLYLVLGALYFLSATETRPSRRIAALALLAASFFGATDELHQSFVPGRTPDVADWAWDTVGAAVGIGTLLLARRLLLRWGGRAADRAGSVQNRGVPADNMYDGGSAADS